MTEKRLAALTQALFPGLTAALYVLILKLCQATLSQPYFLPVAWAIILGTLLAPIVTQSRLLGSALRSGGITVAPSRLLPLAMKLIFLDGNGKFVFREAMPAIVGIAYVGSGRTLVALAIVLAYLIWAFISVKPARTTPPPENVPIVDTPLDERDRWYHLSEIEELIKAKAQGKIQADGSIVIIRGGELGDVLMTTPIIRALRDKYPCTRILYVTRTPEAIAGNPFVSSVLNWNTPSICVHHILSADRVIDYRGVIEAWHGPAIPHMAEIAGVTLEKSTPDFFVSEKDDLWAKDVMSINKVADDRSLVLQASANSPTRCWSWYNITQFAKSIAQGGWTVILLDKTRLDLDIPGVVNLSGQTTIGQAAAIIKHSAMLVGPDSSFQHLAAALDVRSVGIFSVIPPGDRISTYPEAIGIAAKCECAPCYDQFNICEHEPKFDCMNSIQAEEVANAVEELSRRWR
jgi:ADP-heptose:LPS heptosyltransferase